LDALPERAEASDVKLVLGQEGRPGEAGRRPTPDESSVETF